MYKNSFNQLAHGTGLPRAAECSWASSWFTWAAAVGTMSDAVTKCLRLEPRLLLARLAVAQLGLGPLTRDLLAVGGQAVQERRTLGVAAQLLGPERIIIGRWRRV